MNTLTITPGALTLKQLRMVSREPSRSLLLTEYKA